MPTEFYKPLFIFLLLMCLVVSLYWYKKKLQSGFKNSSLAMMRQVGSLNVGTRERLVVIEISNRWLVIGVTAGRMVALAELDKPLPSDET